MAGFFVIAFHPAAHFDSGEISLKSVTCLDVGNFSWWRQYILGQRKKGDSGYKLFIQINDLSVTFKHGKFWRFGKEAIICRQC